LFYLGDAQKSMGYRVVIGSWKPGGLKRFMGFAPDVMWGCRISRYGLLAIASWPKLYFPCN